MTLKLDGRKREGILHIKGMLSPASTHLVVVLALGIKEANKAQDGVDDTQAQHLNKANKRVTQPATLDIDCRVLQVHICNAGSACRDITRLFDAEDVDKLPLEIEVLVATSEDAHLAFALTEFAKGIDILYIATHRLIYILLALHLVKHSLQTAVVALEHHDVDIIVPRDKSLVAGSAKQCAGA